jgi:ribonuclease P protein component
MGSALAWQQLVVAKLLLHVVHEAASVYPPKGIGRMLRRLTKRKEFVKVAQDGVYCPTATLIVQVLFPSSIEAVTGIGFTASRRVGNAVRRNRAKRRLREIVRLILPDLEIPTCDIVVIAKAATVDAPFDILKRDFAYALRKCIRETTK